VPADELYERYLARAISEVNALGDEIARRGDAPSRQPVLGSGHPLGDIFLLKHDPTPAELTEGVAFYGRVGQAVLKSVQRLDIDPLLVYGTNVVKLGGDHGRDERELAERVYPMWLLRELHIVQPKIVVVMGEDTLAVVNGLDLALAKPLEPELGVVQHLTPTIEALVTPALEPSLDDAAAKRAFWAAFRALGEWYAALPPY
jgi:uracil-DNA glycosylase